MAALIGDYSKDHRGSLLGRKGKMYTNRYGACIEFKMRTAEPGDNRGGSCDRSG